MRSQTDGLTNYLTKTKTLTGSSLDNECVCRNKLSGVPAGELFPKERQAINC